MALKFTPTNARLKTLLEQRSLVNPATGCIEWTGTIANGYGRFVVLGLGVLAHRHSYHVNVGPIPAGLFVCHKCDNRKCINPEHLFLGDNTDNMRDMATKGRSRVSKGQANPAAKWTPAQAAAVQKLAAQGVRQSDIVRSTGINQTAVSRIMRGVHWTVEGD